MRVIARAGLAGLIGAIGATNAVAAQPPTGPRTGPDAAPPAAPTFPQPGPPPLMPDPAPAPLAGDASSGALTAVRVIAPDAGRDADAIPPRGWTPATDALSGLRVEHRAGEPLSAAWAERQFALNAVTDTGRAVALVQLINRAFLSAGFVNSGLLVEPGAADDVLILRLVHGRLAGASPGTPAVTVRWADGNARWLSPGYVTDRMPAARRHPLNAAALERDFRLLAEDPALRTVNAQLRPGARPGEASLDLVVLPAAPADLLLTAGNSRSPAVGGERYGATARLRNLLADGDTITLDGGVTAGVVDAAIGYAAPIFTDTFLNLRASYNEAAVVDTQLLPLDIQTRDRSFEGSLLHQFVRAPLTPAGDGRWAPSQILLGGVGFVARRQRSALLGQPFSFAPGAVDGRAEYGALRLIGDYVLRNVDQVFAGAITASFGIGGTRSGRADVLDPDENFFALLVQLNYARRLGDNGLELRARFTGQAASSTLYSGERLSVGGDTSVRGYRESLLLVDEGVVGSLELALPLGGANAAASGFDWGAFTVSAFADAAYVRNRRPPAATPDAVFSVGPALAWQPSDAVSFRIAYGIALVDVVPTGNRDIQDGGIHLRLIVRPLRLLGLR